MTYEEALKDMQDVQVEGDPEIAHLRADNILCSFLVVLGYEELVREFAKVEKWYA